MDFVSKNKVSYIKLGDGNWDICLLEFGFNGITNNVIYKNSLESAFIESSPISENEFMIFYVTNDTARFSFLNTQNSNEKIFLEIPETNGENVKVATSPKGTNVYLLYDNILRIYEISNAELVDKIDSVISAVWIGNSYLLYSNSEGSFLYDIGTKEQTRINSVSMENLSFNPNENGVISYNSDSNGHVISCENWKSLGYFENGKIETLSSERTAITKKDGEGYWRFFNNDWTVKLVDNFYIFTTVWKNY